MLDARVQPFIRLRFTEGRFFHDRWQSCQTHDGALMARVSCPANSSESSQQDVAQRMRLAAQLSRDTTVRARRSLALLELRFAGERGVGRAVSGLRAIATASPASGRAWNDLAVALLVQAQHEQDARVALRALDAIEQAVLVDSSATVLFNRAVIRERLNLRATATRLWSQYLATETNEDWRKEGEARLARLKALDTQTDLPSAEVLVRDSSLFIGEGVPRFDASRLREVGLDALGIWGRAVVDSAVTEAAAALRVARWLASARNSDSAFVRAVALVVQSNEAPTLASKLAVAHAEYSAGFQQYLNNSLTDAVATFTRAEREFRRINSPAWRWAAHFRAASLLNTDKVLRAEAVFRGLAGSSDSPAIRGKALWGLGLIRQRRGQYELASQLYRAALADMTSAEEVEGRGMLASLLAESYEVTGESDLARRAAFEGMRDLAPLRNSRFLTGHLGLMGDLARADGLPFAAIAATDEMLLVWESRQITSQAAWTRALRGIDLVATGRPSAAVVEFRSALALVDRMPPDQPKEQMRADVLLAAVSSGTFSPDSATHIVRELVAHYERLQHEIWLPFALHESARLARANNDTSATNALLAQALTVIDAQRARFGRAEARTRFLETREALYDDMVELQLARGKPERALYYLELAREPVFLGQASATPNTHATLVPRLQELIPANSAVLIYGVLPRQLIVWELTRDTFRVHVMAVTRDSLARAVQRFESAITDHPVASIASGEALFELLIRPAMTSVHGATRLYVVPDRELSLVSFAALRDSERDAYLVERQPIVTLPSAQFLGRRRSEGGSPGRPRALVVGNPAFDRERFPLLESLSGADREANAVGRYYPHQAFLSGKVATRSEVLRLLANHEVFHFAGHAVNDQVDPQSSYLVVAPDVDDDGVIRAWEIAKLRLSSMAMVVLSGCQTAGTRRTHAGAVAGLALSFLRAGASATVTSLWDVDDEESANLLAEFHRAYAGGLDGAEALSAAQRAAIVSSRGRSKESLAWAGFVFTGL